MTKTELPEWEKEYIRSKIKLPEWENEGMPNAVSLSVVMRQNRYTPGYGDDVDVHTIPIGLLTWKDLYFVAGFEMQRNLTKDETKRLFDATRKRLPWALKERFQEDFEGIVGMEVKSMLKEKIYVQESLKGEEITSKKYCHQCEEVQKTYWDLRYCDKNPEGIYENYLDHGNDNTCDDEYCNPESLEVDDEDLTAEYVREHAVAELCTVCGGYLESTGPQPEPAKTDLEEDKNVKN